MTPAWRQINAAALPQWAEHYGGAYRRLHLRRPWHGMGTPGAIPFAEIEALLRLDPAVSAPLGREGFRRIMERMDAAWLAAWHQRQGKKESKPKRKRRNG